MDVLPGPYVHMQFDLTTDMQQLIYFGMCASLRIPFSTSIGHKQLAMDSRFAVISIFTLLSMWP